MPVTTRPELATTPNFANLAALRFPLLPRPKPICRSLPDRIERVRQQALTAQHDQSLDHAAKALNLAALIYSDCQMPDAARALCWRQFDVFVAGGPYDEPTAKTAVQPLINIGRLETRAGHGTKAYDLHEAMFTGARDATPFTVDGRDIDLRAIARPGNARHALAQTLWMVLLADGFRALCRAGRWDHAYEQASTHRGIGERLLDGRQIAIIAAATHGNLNEARVLIESTVVTEDWERLVAACLRVLTGELAEGRTAGADIGAMLEAYNALDQQPEHTVFLVRSGLTVIDLAYANSGRPVAEKFKRIIDDLDAYAAMELLSHTPELHLPRTVIGTLGGIVAAAGLGAYIPEHLELSLTAAVDNAVRALEQIVAAW